MYILFRTEQNIFLTVKMKTMLSKFTQCVCLVEREVLFLYFSPLTENRMRTVKSCFENKIIKTRENPHPTDLS